MVRVALFSIYGCPEYLVVVGRLNDHGRTRMMANGLEPAGET